MGNGAVTDEGEQRKVGANPKGHVASLVATAAFLLVAVSLPLPTWLFVVVLTLSAALIRLQIVHLVVLERVFAASVKLRKGKPLHRWFTRTRLIRVISWFLAFVASYAAFVAAATYSMAQLAAVVLSLVIAAALTSRIASVVDNNCTESFSLLANAKVYCWLSGFCVVISLALASLVTDYQTDGGSISAAGASEFARGRVAQTVPAVQLPARAIVYFGQTGVRVRDQMPQPYGWLTYLIFFLPPSAFPVAGVVLMHLGVHRFLGGPGVADRLGIQTSVDG